MESQQKLLPENPGIQSSNKAAEEPKTALTEFEMDNSHKGPEQKAASQEKSGVSKMRHWLWDNWILLSMFSLISFTTTNLLIGALSPLGMQGVNYFCFGNLLASVIYFACNRECSKRNLPSAKDQDGKCKVLMRTWDNRVDWYTIAFCILSAVWQFFIYASAMLCFKVAKSAGLNIGIAQCIWALNPFLVAVIERVFWGVGLAKTQVFGMCSLVACTICVSLSELFQADDSLQEIIVVDGKTPVYVAVLTSLVFPLVCAVFSVLIKYADKNLRLDAFDWNCSSLGLMSFAFQIVGVVNFSTGAVPFDLGHFIRGSFGSLFNLSGTVWIIAAFNSDGAPFGPILALVNM